MSKIKQLHKASGLSYKSIAERFGISESYAVKLLNGSRQPIRSNYHERIENYLKRFIQLSNQIAA